MRMTSFQWQLYVTTYTSLLGIPLLLFPDAVIPYLGFNPTGEVWVRLTGGLLVALGGITFSIYRLRIREMIMPSVYVRLGIGVILLLLGLAGYPPFLFAMAAIVLVGVAGTVVSHRKATG